VINQQALSNEGLFMTIYYGPQKAPLYVEKHYTPIALAVLLLQLVPISPTDRALDPASGKNNVFHSNFPTKHRLKRDIDTGSDFLKEPI
jgi:hypothetical protein